MRGGPGRRCRSRGLAVLPAEEVPEPKAQTIQRDLHKAQCACGKIHVAPRRRRP